MVTALTCVILSGCAARTTATVQTAADHAVSPAPRQDALSGDDDAQMRFLALITRVAQGCAPGAAGNKGGDTPPEPEDVLGGRDEPTPVYGPGETPPGVPDAVGDIPVPLDDPGPPEATPDSTQPEPAQEVTLTGIEKCEGDEHAERVTEAFENTRTTAYQALEQKLADLDYPASQIRRMPDPAGAPRARIDLRFMGGHLALEITAAGRGVTVEAFGVPETETVEVTDVKRKPGPDAPTA
ncbi:hypothetical protein ACIP98_36980 [Streptomyces sp. NPDC088354]|uniref:hypothetical protein n=1 Tax=unclassified Streptomyces TaxID=2593676 RepID=UPI0029A5CD9A|nr:hypothetical protein [Streptomyces sp. MI02-7b]MDX3077819.1 hypothetical protein [Streptomyces sp. MI02-7b]